jgi:hypothetical protein
MSDFEDEEEWRPPTEAEMKVLGRRHFLHFLVGTYPGVHWSLI